MHTSKHAAAFVVVSFLVIGGAWIVGDRAHAVEIQPPTGDAASPVLVPLARGWHTMAYDAESDRAVVFGGDMGFLDFVNDTWSYGFTSNAWTPMHPSPHPSGRESAGLTYNVVSDRLVLFGGYTGSESNETWSYDLNSDTWALMHPASAPSPRHYLPLAYDIAADRIVLVGGSTATGAPFNDTWTYDLGTDTWTNQNPAVRPPARSEHAMAYSSKADKVVVFGGLTRTPGGAEIRNNDTWTYDLTTNTWTRMAPVRAPSPRWYPVMAYDPKADVFVLFGGATQPGDSAETWSYDLNTDTWTSMNPANPPAGREIPGFVYDAKADRFVLFGGKTASRVNGETWSYDYANNTWALRIPEQAPTAPENLQAIGENEGIRLVWVAPASPGSLPVTSYRVYRSTSSGSETLLTTGGDTLAYTDGAATKGQTYYYQVAAVNGIGEGARSTEASAQPTPAPDTVLPTVSIASPLEGATLTTTSVTITGSASDNVEVAKVELSLDGTTWTAATGTTSWSATLTLAEGANTITVRATDTSGNVATQALHVTVATSGGAPTGPSGAEGIPWWAWGLVAVTAAVLGALVLILIRRRRAGSKEGPPR